MNLSGNQIPKREADDSERLERLFALSAHSGPAACAIHWRNQQFSYAWLEKRAAQIGVMLRAQGLTHGSRVALALNRSPNLIAAMLGVLRIGAAYVPIDPATPLARMSFILKDCNANAVVLDGAFRPPADFDGGVISLDAIDFEKLEDDLPDERFSPDDLAYILYTSGSSGRPKGVMLSHNASRYLKASIAHFSEGQMSRVAAVTSVAFDPSIFEIFGTLAAAGTIVLKDHALEPFADGDRPTLLQGVPSALGQLARAGAIPHSVRVINCGGETLSGQIAQTLYNNTGIEELYNHYGPTEATICATIALVAREDLKRPSVGFPVAGATIHIRDANGAPVPQGDSGEILIGGPGLAIGYLNHPELTNERFVLDTRTGARLYRTGDQGHILASGALQFERRLDEQVKVRGHRIELAEIDDALLGIPGVRDAAAALIDRGDAPAFVVGFLSGLNQDDLHASADVLRDVLPGYMIPRALRPVARIPRLLSGKIDRAELASRFEADAGGRAISALPLDEPRAHDPGLGGSDKAGALAPASPALLDFVCAEFARSLGRPGFGADEDFFEAGADSLMAVEVILALEKTTRSRLAPDTLFHYPTPRSLVEYIEQSGPDDALLLKAGATGQGSPLYFAPGIRGDDGDYQTLMRHLTDHRLLMMRSIPIAPDLERCPAIETISDRLLPLITDASPEGCVTVVGYSFGGIVAYDIARRLIADQREVQLVLIDPQIQRAKASLRKWWRWFPDEVLEAVSRQGPVEAGVRLVRSLAFWYPKTLGKIFPHELPSHVATESEAFVSNLIRAAAKYKYQPVSLRTLLIKANLTKDDDKLLNPDGLGGWSGLLSGDLTVATFECRHGEFIYEPFAARVAKLISDWVRRETASPMAGERDLPPKPLLTSPVLCQSLVGS